MGPNGRPSIPFYNFLQSLDRAVQAGDTAAIQQQIEAIARALGSPDGSVAGIPPAAFMSAAAQAYGLFSVQSVGSLQDGAVAFQLVGDDQTPGGTYYYGTTIDGTKGFFAVADTVEAESGELTKVVDGGGVTTFGLADLADSGAGTFKLLARDAKGRLSGTADGTTSDVPEGGNLYFTDARARTAAVADTITPGVTDIAPSQNAVSDALALKAPLLRPQFTDWVGVGVAPDRPFVLDTASNALPAGSASFMLVGDSNKERLEMRGSGSSDPVFQGKRSSGTKGAPGATTPGVLLAAFGGAGHNGADWVTGNNALISLQAAETFTASAQGARIAFATTAVGTTARLDRWGVENNGHFLPWSDNAYDVGSGALRARVIYAGTGAINTSDAREKTTPRDLSDVELACASELARLPSIFQWLQAIEEKGEGVRLHCSPTVQSVIAAMEKHGLDPFRYGFVCYDAWPERTEPAEYETVEVTPAVTRDHPAIYERTQVYTEDGQPERFAERLVTPAWTEVIEPAVTEDRIVREAVTHPAGDRYSLRPSELAHFIMRGLVYRLDRLEALESQRNVSLQPVG